MGVPAPALRLLLRTPSCFLHPSFILNSHLANSFARLASLSDPSTSLRLRLGAPSLGSLTPPSAPLVLPMQNNGGGDKRVSLQRQYCLAHNFLKLGIVSRAPLREINYLAAHARLPKILKMGRDRAYCLIAIGQGFVKRPNVIGHLHQMVNVHCALPNAVSCQPLREEYAQPFSAPAAAK